MIRNARLGDLISYFSGDLRGCLNQAHPRNSIANSDQPISFKKLIDAVLKPYSNNQKYLTVSDGMHLLAVVAASARISEKSWELSNLYTTKNADFSRAELLEHCVRSVGNCGCERIFWRLKSGDPIQSVAVSAGFNFLAEEHTYSPAVKIAQHEHFAMLKLRPLVALDLHDVFRLYNECTPQAVRSLYALTLEQWQSARERSGPNTEEFVWEREGRVRGWIRIIRGNTQPVIDAMLHPNEAAAAPLLFGEVLRLCGDYNFPIWIVQEYQPEIRQILEEHRWVTGLSYWLYVKRLVKSVEDAAMVALRA